MEMLNEIKFYAVSNEYGEFSNFYNSPIKVGKYTWPTVEHYFQAQKFAGSEYEHMIRKAKSPMKAAELGRNRKIKIRSDWESVKINVMREAVHTKFHQHPELRILLLSTGDAKIIEHTSNDNFWGDGGDGKGQNWLGKILMEIRAEFKTVS